jgi:SSS family transporter
MSYIDWIVLVVTLAGIIVYGVYKSRTSRNLDGYFLGDRQMPWWLVLLSIMGTQASAVTFLSAPGQAYTDGMRFVQYYFGLPIAMVIICIAFVPIFHKLKVYTAYEYLEQRFDVKTRTLTSFLFLLSRGLSTGISVFAPSIILSSLFGWNIYWTNIFMGGLLIIYTVTGGAKAVAYTQQLQLIIVFIGMFLAAYLVVKMLPSNIGFIDALKVSGKMGKLNVITTGVKKDGSFNWSDQYNLFSGLIGGLFLALSYFGTDQSQVGRYLTAKSATESKIGLLMNGLVKVPMQFAILLIGALVFTFYQFKSAPLFFNQVQVAKVQSSVYADSAKTIQLQYDSLNKQKEKYVAQFVDAYQSGQSTTAVEKDWKNIQAQTDTLRTHYKNIVKQKEVGGDANDTNYIFLHFVVDYLPVGLVGLLIAIIFLASWGSIAAALNSLASCTMVDFHRRFTKRELSEETEYRLSKWYSFGWGVFCIIIAMFAYNLGNSLIEAVNVLGSLFYGVILGIFLVAFFLKNIGGKAVFIAAIITELFILFIFYLIKTEVLALGFLWLNPIGAGGVILVSMLLQSILPYDQKKEET